MTVKGLCNCSEDKKREKSWKDSSSRHSQNLSRSSQHYLSCYNQTESFLKGTETESHSIRKDGSIPNRGSVVATAIQPTEQSGKPPGSKRQVRALKDAIDSLQIAKESLKLKRRNSKVVNNSSRCDGFESSNQPESSRNKSRRSKSDACSMDSHSQSISRNETSGNSSFTNPHTHRCAVKSKVVCVCCTGILVTPATGSTSDSKVKKHRKKDLDRKCNENHRKVEKLMSSEKKKKDGKMNF